MDWAEERAREILDNPKNFVRDPVAGVIPMHFNAFYDVFASELRAAERRGIESAAQWCRDRYEERKIEGMPHVIPKAAKSRSHYAERRAGGQSMLLVAEERIRALAAPPADATGG